MGTQWPTLPEHMKSTRVVSGFTKGTVIPVKNVVDVSISYLKDAPLEILIDVWKPRIQQWEIDIMQMYGDRQDPDIQRLRRALNREIKKRKERAGTVKTPQAIVRTTPIDNKYLLNLDGPVVDDMVETSGELLAEGYENILGRKDAGYILDSVGTYIEDYYQNGPTATMSLDGDGSYYIIRDTFDNFCKRSGITGETRRQVREALFPTDPGKAGLLERIKLKILRDQDKRTHFVTFQFITARKVHTVQRENALPNEKETVEWFEMAIDAQLYKFLERKDVIETGHGKHHIGVGWWDLPRAMNYKVEERLRYMRRIAKVSPGQTKYLKAFTRRGELEKYRKGLAYLIDKWNTGFANREQDMVVPFSELSKDMGILPRNSKKRDRQREDMEALWVLCESFWSEREAFPGCSGIELSPKLELVFRLERGK